MYQKIIAFLTIIIVLQSCGTSQKALKPPKVTPIGVTMDLINVLDDKVSVTIRPNLPQKTPSETVTYHIPKIVPGTYSIDNYGTFIEDLKAYNAKGEELTVVKEDDNSWTITTSSPLDKITYLVNDTFDVESEHDIFSPSGTNILKDENFVLNLHGFIGYFKGHKELPYLLEIAHPETLKGVTSLPRIIENTPTPTKDRYNALRYADLTDNPMMYAKPDIKSFKLNDIEVTLSVYSPNGTHTAASLKPAMEKMMTAQKNFLGTIDATKIYNIILYLSDMSPENAQGFGALEHNTSTVVVLPEVMQLDRLNQTMVDVVSHEFFHIVTPLNIHSEEIHFFDYNTPKMSQHLWMYEGTTEYFAQLFQIQQKLISKEAFFERIIGKVAGAKRYDDTMSFTKMSKNILEEPYKSNYINVYEKGTLISMCIDILIREKSKGERGILDVMKALSKEYGSKKPFEDSELIAKITQLTYPEVGAFIEKHVVGTTPINYSEFWDRVGIAEEKVVIPGPYFASDTQPYITGSEENNLLFFIPGMEYNSFLNQIGIKGGDILVSINDKKYTLQNAYDLFEDPKKWTDGMPIKIVVERNEQEVILEGKAKAPTSEKMILKPVENSSDAQQQLLKSWIGA